jgi:hypothetical protein
MDTIHVYCATEIYKEDPIYLFYGKYIFRLKYETIRIRFQFSIINRNENLCYTDVRKVQVTKNRRISFNSVQDYGMRLESFGIRWLPSVPFQI